MEQLLEGLPEQRAPETTGRGAPRLVRAERRQVELRPMSLDDMIGPEHLARLVWRMVQRFDRRDRRICRDLFMRRLALKFAVPSVTECPVRGSPAGSGRPALRRPTCPALLLEDW
jgi:hypothetical protein